MPAVTSGTTCWPTASGGTRAGRKCTCPLSTGGGPGGQDGLGQGRPQEDGTRSLHELLHLGRRFTELRNDPDHAWLKDYPYKVVRYSLKYLADAYARYKADPENAGKPRFKGRHFTRAGVHHSRGHPDGRRPSVRAQGGLAAAGGSNPYADCRPLTVRVRMEGTEQHPKWYAYVCYEVPAEQ